MDSFYNVKELNSLGFGKVGKNVLISKYARFYGQENMIIGDNVRIDDFCVLSGTIAIGDYVHIAAFSCLFAGNLGIYLKDFSGISSRCSIYAVTDDYSGNALTNPMVPNKYRNVTGGPVVLEKHSLIGTGSTILPGVTVGEGTSVGAMSLVVKNLDSWGIYVGIPAKRIKERAKTVLSLERKCREDTYESK